MKNKEHYLLTKPMPKAVHEHQEFYLPVAWLESPYSYFPRRGNKSITTFSSLKAAPYFINREIALVLNNI